MSYRFPKQNRLLDRREFLRIKHRGQRIAEQSLLFKVLSYNKANPPKLGITAPKKIGPAVLRNRYKRLIREAFRKILPSLPSGIEISVLPKTKDSPPTFSEIERDFSSLAKRIEKVF